MNTIARTVADQSVGTRNYVNPPADASSVEKRKLRRLAARTKPKFVATSHEETEFWEDVT
jgi:hypothetical protein